jgi:hypothetical protein
VIELLESRLLCYSVASRWFSTATEPYGTRPAPAPITLTYSFRPGFDTVIAPAFGSAAKGRYLIRQALAEWSKVSGVDFEFEPADDGAAGPYQAGSLGVRGDVRIDAKHMDGPYGLLGSTYTPNSGDMTLDADDFAAGGAFRVSSNNWLTFRQTVAHEAGHAIGLNHTNVPNSLMNASLSLGFDGPQADDIAGARSLYGNPPRAGDSNRDGVVNILDYGLIDFGIRAGLSGWVHGDFNYDGKIDVLDYGIIDAAFGH